MVQRFSISLEGELLASLKRFCSRHKYANRSEAVRDLIRHALVADQWQSDTTVVMGVISLVYDHHRRNLLNRITAIQHDSKAHIASTMHVHMDHHNCLETIVAKGTAVKIRELADKLISLRGVKTGSLSTACTGHALP